MTKTEKPISIIVPVYNEEWSIRPLYGKLLRALANYNLREIIFVDDGSTDGTGKSLEELVSQEDIVRVIYFRRNFGLTQALQAGIDYATGEYIVTISGNMQHEPADIPKLLTLLDEGYDVSVGWPIAAEGELKRRKSRSLHNWVISKISGVTLHDYDCILRAYKNELLEGMQLYGNLERYIPIYVFWKGGKISEVEVLRHPRGHGEEIKRNQTKESIKTMLDLLMLKFLERFSDRPLYIFGVLGVGSVGFGIAAFLWMLWLKIIASKAFVETPLPLVTVLFILTGVLLMVLGVMSEFLSRIYHTGENKGLYSVKTTSGFQ